MEAAPNGAADAAAAIPVAQSMALANAILGEAGWRPIPKPCWGGGFVMARQVGGVAPDGTQYVKGLDIVKPGDPAYGPDTPDEHHEAAAWLVEHARARANPLSTQATLEPPEIAVAGEGEAGEIPAHEAHGETGAEAGIESADLVVGGIDRPDSGDDDGGASPGFHGPVVDEPSMEAADAFGGEGAESVLGMDEGSDAGDRETGLALQADPLDAEFTEPVDPAGLVDDDFADLPELEPPELGEELAEEHPEYAQPPQDRFYGLDDLGHRRSLRIGEVWQAAEARMPAWNDEDDARLRELRNFTAAVSEGRWTYDQDMQEELDTLEAVLRCRARITAFRDTEIGRLSAAEREVIDAYKADEIDWPD